MPRGPKEEKRPADVIGPAAQIAKMASGGSIKTETLPKFQSEPRPWLHFSAIRRMVLSITINGSYALMVTMKGKRILTSLYLDPPVHKALRQLSETTRVPAAAYLREAVEDLLKKYGVKAPGGRKP
jgi:Ribbon-helix-helix domain